MAWIIADHIVILIFVFLALAVLFTLYMMYRTKRKADAAIANANSPENGNLEQNQIQPNYSQGQTQPYMPFQQQPQNGYPQQFSVPYAQPV